MFTQYNQGQTDRQTDKRTDVWSVQETSVEITLSTLGWVKYIVFFSYKINKIMYDDYLIGYWVLEQSNKEKPTTV